MVSESSELSRREFLGEAAAGGADPAAQPASPAASSSATAASQKTGENPDREGRPRPRSEIRDEYIAMGESTCLQTPRGTSADGIPGGQVRQSVRRARPQELNRDLAAFEKHAL